MKKRGIVSDYLPWIIIAVVVLTVLMIAIFLLREKGVGLIDRIKGLFTGGK
jgi:hypothetical protein